LSKDFSGFAALQKSAGVDLVAGAWQNFLRQAGHLARRTAIMTMQSHLAELERRHRALEEEIAEALAHPSADDLKIAELKRRKLQVKDEIARLRQKADGVH
jgi:hypothetical protein